MAGLLYDALELAVAKYNTAKGTNYKFADFTFEKPIDLRTIGITHPSRRNTMIRGTVEDKTIEFTYDRLDLTAHHIRDSLVLGGGSGGIFLETTAVDKSEAAITIAKTCGIPITPSDIVKEPFDWATLRTATSTNVVFTIAPESRTFLPGSTFTVLVGGAYILVEGKVYRVQDCALELETFYEDYAYQTNPKITPATAPLSGHQTAPFDYSKAARYLRRLSGYETWRDADRLGKTGDPSNFIKGLCQALKECDGNPWVWNTTATPADFNLYQAWVVFNGPVEFCTRERAQQYRVPAQYLPLHELGNPAFDNVCLVWPAITAGQTQSVYVFHYNDIKGVA